MSADSAAAGAELLARARLLHGNGRHVDAESAVLSALAKSAEPATAYRLLASIEKALARPEREARALGQALAMCEAETSDDTAQLWTRLAVLRARLGYLQESLHAYEHAVAAQPGYLPAHQGLARMRFALQDLDGVQQSVTELQRRFPEHAFTHLIAGHMLKALGDTPAATECYARALERNPDLGEALYNLVDLAPPDVDNPLAAHAAVLASRVDLAAADRINAGFAYARILDRAARYSDSFHELRRANELARDVLAHQGIVYHPPGVEARFGRTMTEYPEQTFCLTLDPLPVGVTPVFVVGLPRSGTTLVEQILASHPDVQAGGELPFARDCEYRFRVSRVTAGRDGPVNPADPVDAELLESARERYLDALFERGLDGPWIIDKLPANFEIAGFLRSIFPHAPVIHCVRDPHATCFSLYKANFGAHEPWYHDLVHMAHYYGQYRRLMAHWAKALTAPFLEVAYEELVLSPDARIPALLEAIGLPFDPACFEFYRHNRPILTASHAQVRRPIYTDSIDHWRHYTDWLGPLAALPPVK